MRKFFESGGLFMVVALLSVAAGIVSENGGVFVGAGAFWLIMAIIVRSKNANKPSGDKDEDAT